MTTTVRLDIRDLPRDPDHCQGQLRTELLKMANYVRKFPKKADPVIELLEFVTNHINMNIAIEAGIEEAIEPKELTVAEQLEALAAGIPKLGKKSDVVEQASKVGLTLDEDGTRDELNAALTAKYIELIKIQESK
jgi:hypothetical protein